MAPFQLSISSTTAQAGDQVFAMPRTRVGNSALHAAEQFAHALDRPVEHDIALKKLPEREARHVGTLARQAAGGAFQLARQFGGEAQGQLSVHGGPLGSGQSLKSCVVMQCRITLWRGFQRRFHGAHSINLLSNPVGEDLVLEAVPAVLESGDDARGAKSFQSLRRRVERRLAIEAERRPQA